MNPAYKVEEIGQVSSIKFTLLVKLHTLTT